MEKMLGCCFSGYRTDKFDFKLESGSEQYRLFETMVVEETERAIHNGYTMFYNGVSEGFDLIAAEITLMLKKSYEKELDIRLISVVPFQNQSAGWSKLWKSRYESVLERSDEVVVLNETFKPWGYHERNRYLVDNSDRLIVYYSGKTGGTKYTFEYAMKKDIQIINIWERMRAHI